MTTTEPSPAPAPNTGVTIASAAKDPMASRSRLWSVVDSLNIRSADLIARHGVPSSIEARAFESQVDPGKTDSVVYLRYPLFESMYRVRSDRSTALSHVTISEPVAGIPAEARPGASLTSLIAYLGTPDDQSKEDEGLLLLFKREPHAEDGNVFNVMVTGGRVKWVSWVFFPEVWWPPRPRS